MATEMNDCAWGQETGRLFVYDDYNAKLVNVVPDHEEWHLWTEFKDEDGEFTYVSDDPDGYWLDAEEFGPIDAGIAGRVIADREETEPCEANTPGCCIDHRHDHGSCESW
jgi:hypothetical protein